MDKAEFLPLIEEAAAQVGQGAFLMTGREPVNPMTIGWAQWGIIWGKPICTVLVRQSRFTHELIEKDGYFTVSVPHSGTMKEALAFCGRASGRDHDKLRELDANTLSPRVDGCIPAYAGCSVHFECRVVFKAESDLGNMDAEYRNRHYGANQVSADGDPHTVYFGEIVAAYRE